MKTKFRILKAELSDTDEIFSLFKKTPEMWDTHGANFYSMDKFSKYINRDQWVILKAVSDDELLGFIVSFIDIDFMMTELLCVKPEFRNLGIGSALLKESIKIANERGVFFACCFADPEFPKTINFWKKMKFREGKRFVYFYKMQKNFRFSRVKK